MGGDLPQNKKLEIDAAELGQLWQAPAVRV
jgi:hypothetical protein